MEHAGEISLRTLATMLPASMSVGSITPADISLEQLPTALPDLDALTAALDRETIQVGSAAPARGLPRACVRFENVGSAIRAPRCSTGSTSSCGWSR